MKLHNKSAVTLVELIVVIAIVLVIAALVFPVLTKSKRSASHTVCTSNLRQLYAAYNLYAADNNDLWPTLQPIEPPILVYTKQVRFTCPIRKQLFPNRAPNIPDYLNVGAVVPSEDPSLRKAREECEAIRGPSFPVLLDKNHRSQRAKVTIDENWIFVARKDGSVTKRRPFVMNSFGIVEDTPCDRRIENINF